jgi:hypothetical protein
MVAIFVYLPDQMTSVALSFLAKRSPVSIVDAHGRMNLDMEGLWYDVKGVRKSFIDGQMAHIGESDDDDLPAILIDKDLEESISKLLRQKPSSAMWTRCTDHPEFVGHFRKVTDYLRSEGKDFVLTQFDDDLEQVIGACVGGKQSLYGIQNRYRALLE